MALVTCSECRKEVSDKASSCPHCGCPIQGGGQGAAPVAHKEEKKSPIRTGIFGCLGVLLIIGFIGAAVDSFQKGDSSGDGTQYTGTTGTTARRPAPRRTIQAIQVTARELYRAYKKNEVAADMKYKGKYVMVSGRIDSIGKDVLNNMYVSLKSQRNRYQMIGFIQCYFSTSHKRQLASLSKGQQVVLLGKVSGKLGNISVKGCRVLKK